MILAIDFDGVICENDYPEVGKQIPNSIPVLKKLQQIGHSLILWTCRDGESLNNAIEFCKKKGLEFDAINENLDFKFKTSNKIYADVYIDDRGINGIPNWIDIYKMLVNKK
jgi:histidinol phosphatase-like enzyme